MVGSSTTSPSFVKDFMRNSSISTGFCAGCTLLFWGGTGKCRMLLAHWSLTRALYVVTCL
eukprot:13963-Eustigmatos_ZCMA.PRE.1